MINPNSMVQCLLCKTNVVVERLTLLLRFLEVPGSNLDPDTSYLDLGFSSLQANAGKVP
jgi:hypothetical protein